LFHTVLVSERNGHIMNSRKEAIFEALLKIAANESLLREAEALPSSEELGELYKPSAAMDKKIRKMIARAERAKKRKIIFKTAQTITAVFAVVLILSSVALLSIEASRNYIFNTIIEWQESHTSFEFSQDDNSNTFDKYPFSYIPEGFTLQNSSENENMKALFFSDESGQQIVFQQTLAESSILDVDNENKHYRIVNINGMDVYLFESTSKGDDNILIWQEDDIAFELISSININQLIEIAENVINH